MGLRSNHSDCRYLTAGVQLLHNKRGSNSPKGPEATRKQPLGRPLPPGHAAISRPIFLKSQREGYSPCQPSKNSTIMEHSPREKTEKRRSQRSGKKAEPRRQSAKTLHSVPPPTLSQLARTRAEAGPHVPLKEEATLEKGLPSRKLGVRRRPIYL